MSWTHDIELILNDLRENAVHLSNHHKRRYFYYKEVSSCFRIPTIIISSIASVASAGSLINYVSQEHISGIVCLLSLSVGIINSIELYLRIQDNLENELETSKAYYNLSTDIHMTINLAKENRDGQPKKMLDIFYKRYCDLVEKSNLLSNNYPDKLARLPKLKGIFKKKNSDSSSSSSVSSENPMDEQHIAEL